MRFDIRSQNFRKPLVDISPRIERKTFRRIFSHSFGCRKKALSDFLVASSSLKTANTGKPAAQNINLIFKLKDSGFLETFRYSFVFVNENSDV